jgi:hypothetical protein
LQCNLPTFHPIFLFALAGFAIRAKLEYGIKFPWFASNGAMIARWVVAAFAYQPLMIWQYSIGLHLRCHAWILVVHPDFVQFRPVKVKLAGQPLGKKFS